MTFLDLFRKYITHHSVSNVFFEKRKAVTLQAYNNKYRIINDFLFEKSIVKLKAIEFSVSTSKDLLEWSSSKYSHNYSVRIVEICKDVLDFGLYNEFIDSHSLPILKLKRQPSKAPIYLTPSEIIALEKYKPGDSMKEKAKDLFLLQCYTGMDYTDITSVSEENIIFFKERYYILKKRNKSGVDAYIPYSDNIKLLLKKHDFNLKILSNVNYNATLKHIATDLKIDKHLTTHVGRKTCAMLSLNHKGYSIEAVSKMLGHKSIKTTENHYAQVNINLISRELDRLGI